MDGHYWVVPLACLPLIFLLSEIPCVCLCVLTGEVLRQCSDRGRAYDPLWESLDFPFLVFLSLCWGHLCWSVPQVTWDYLKTGVLSICPWTPHTASADITCRVSLSFNSLIMLCLWLSVLCFGVSVWLASPVRAGNSLSFPMGAHQWASTVYSYVTSILVLDMGGDYEPVREMVFVPEKLRNSMGRKGYWVPCDSDTHMTMLSTRSVSSPLAPQT